MCSGWTGPTAGPAQGGTPAARIFIHGGRDRWKTKPRKGEKSKLFRSADRNAARRGRDEGRRSRLPAGSSPAHPGEVCVERNAQRPCKAAALQLRRGQGRASRPRCAFKEGPGHEPVSLPGGIRAGRPRPARQAERGSPPPLHLWVQGA